MNYLKRLFTPVELNADKQALDKKNNALSEKRQIEAKDAVNRFEAAMKELDDCLTKPEKVKEVHT